MASSITCKPELTAAMLATLDAQRGPGNRPSLPKRTHAVSSIPSLARRNRFAHPVPKRAGALLTLLLVLWSLSGALAQSAPSSLKRVTGHIGFGGSSKQGYLGTYGLQAITHKALTFSLSYHDINLNPKSLPKDYDPGYEVWILIPVPNGYPEAKLSLLSATVGKSFAASRTISFSTQAGLSLVKGETFNFQRQEVATDFWGSKSPNYSATRKSKRTIGMQLQADATWAFSSFAGLSTGVFANFNSIQSPIGMEVKLVLGWMNRAPKKKA